MKILQCNRKMLLMSLQMQSPRRPNQLSQVICGFLLLMALHQSIAAAPVKVALYRGPGTAGKGPPNLMRLLNAGNQFTITEITPQEIQAGRLTNFHAVIFAGGGASVQANALEESGREAVRNFVGHGGGYIGICAGAYLATSGFSWSLHLINARTVSSKWQRGVGEVKMEMTDPGRKILGQPAGQFPVLYANGPIVAPADEASLPPYETLACFRTELAKNGSPVGVMVNSPALFGATYRRGRVLCFSPHPEQTDGLEGMVLRAVQWVAPQPQTRKLASPRMTE